MIIANRGHVCRRGVILVATLQSFDTRIGTLFCSKKSKKKRKKAESSGSESEESSDDNQKEKEWVEACASEKIIFFFFPIMGKIVSFSIADFSILECLT